MSPMLMGHACSHPTCNKIIRSKYCNEHKHIQSDVSRGTQGILIFVISHKYGNDIIRRF